MLWLVEDMLVLCEVLDIEVEKEVEVELVLVLLEVLVELVEVD